MRNLHRHGGRLGQRRIDSLPTRLHADRNEMRNEIVWVFTSSLASIMSDLFIRNEGKIFLVIPGSRAGHAWIDNNVAVNRELFCPEFLQALKNGKKIWTLRDVGGPMAVVRSTLSTLPKGGYPLMTAAEAANGSTMAGWERGSICNPRSPRPNKREPILRKSSGCR
jgi:hypothetical protein